MNFILENYLIIILVGFFFVFALIGYLIDMLKNNKEKEKEEIPINIKPVELKDLKKEENIIGTPKEIDDTNENVNEEDDLLKNYNEDITE